MLQGNTVLANRPSDLVYDLLGTSNRFDHNACATSNPPGLCPAGHAG